MSSDDPTFEDIRDDLEEWEATLPVAEFVARALAAAAAMAPGADGRAELLAVAGERLGHQDPLRALDLHDEATRDGGPTTIDPRVNRLTALIDLGREDEVTALLAGLRRDPGPRTSLVGLPATVGEVLEIAGRLREAQRWYSIGLRDFDPSLDAIDDPDGLGEPDQDEDYCLSGRYRVRRALGAGLDAFDRWFEDDAPDTAAAIRERARAAE